MIFIWQVAVRGDARNNGLAKSLLRELIGQDVCRNIRFVEATITPSNEASSSLFRSLAKELGADCFEAPFFSRELFAGKEEHEEEFLLQIGPLTQ